jgi:lipopolysaccharide/colanic/teichoic acid biosynthesis glycosyltransferase
MDGLDVAGRVDRAASASLGPGRRGPRRILIVGTGERAVRAAAHLTRNGAIVLGAIDDALQPALAGCSPPVPWLGGLDRLADETLRRHAEELFVALPLRSGFDAWLYARAVARDLGIPATLELDLTGERQRTRLLAGSERAPVVEYNRHPSQLGLRRITKRALDLSVAVSAIALLAPLLLAAAIGVKLTSPGPVIFRQGRVGLSRRRFQMLKFRTMDVGAEGQSADLPTLDPHGVMFKADVDPRVTRFGSWLRRTSVDELPQLFNVLRGDMSLVGPRPMPTWVYDRVPSREFHRRSAVLPGMTGLWQVNGRHQDLGRMTADDLSYVEGWSIRQDLSILRRTPLAVLKGTGAK